jgi:EAL domain-containing protein (putative c-di-GMP-specific phosphodiesterase class I)
MQSEDAAAVLERTPGDAVPAARYVATFVAALIGTVVSIAAFVAVSNLEAPLAGLKLQELARSQTQSLNSNLQYATGVLYTLRAYFTAADRTIERPEFQAFALSSVSTHAIWTERYASALPSPRNCTRRSGISNWSSTTSPQVELPSGRITGIEALVRWNHPTRGLLLPDVFVPVAETTGTIFALGRWVLEEACRKIRQWRSEGIVPPLVAVNFSPAQFKETPNLDRELADKFHKFDLDPSCIEIELTEVAVVETTQAHNDIIERLRKMGISIAIDDFGTEYSSLEYLRTYRVNCLKIAQQFLRQVATEPGDAAIVRAALGLARELGMEAVAEGVETADQLAFLLTVGCRFAQGYYFSGPVPAAETGALLRRGEICASLRCDQ